MTEPRRVVDTNVPIIANLQGTVSDACALSCIQLLRAIQTTGHLVLDAGDLILSEYRTYLNFAGQPGVGDAFYRWVHDNRYNPERCTLIPLSENADRGFDEFPNSSDLADFDPSDRKFVAASHRDPRSASIAVAVDRGWRRFEDALERVGISIDFICPEDLPPL